MLREKVKDIDECTSPETTRTISVGAEIPGIKVDLGDRAAPIKTIDDRQD